MRFLNNDILKLVVRLFLGGLFIYASLAKIADPAGFAKIVGYYNLIPFELQNAFALVLPWLELLTGIALILGVWHDGAAYWYFALIAIFIVAVGISIVRGVDLSCGCFSTSPDSRGASWLLLIEDFGLLILALYLMAMGAGRFALSRPQPR